MPLTRQRWVAGATLASALVLGGPAAAAAGPATTPTPATHGSVPLSAAQRAAVPPGTALRAPAAATAPTAATLSITGVYQDTGYNCVPASSSVSLKTFGVSVSQDTLATKMGTTTKGTWDTTALPVINGYVNPLAYSMWDVDTTGDPDRLLTDVAYDVGTLKRAPKIGVWMEKLPWNSGLSGHFGHAMVVYGYDTTARTVTVWDPWKPTGGKHTLSVTALNAAMQAGGLSFVGAHVDADWTSAGDLSGDGKPDMVAVNRATGTLYRYDNRGTTFEGAAGSIALGTGWNGMTELAGVGDLTGDGKPDLAAVEKSTGKLWLYPGPGLNAGRILIGTSGWNGMRDLIGVGNVTGDSHPDLVAIESSTGKLWAYPGKANGLGTRVQIGTSWTHMGSLAAVGDMTGDGKPDFAAVDVSTGKLWLYRGPTFPGGTRIQLGSGGWNGMRSLTGVGDLTGDGKPDLLAVANSDGSMYVYPGTGGALGTRVRLGGGWN